MKLSQILVTVTVLSTLMCILITRKLTHKSFGETTNFISKDGNVDDRDDVTEKILKMTTGDMKNNMSDLKTSIQQNTVDLPTPQSWFKSTYIINEESLCRNNNTDILFYIHTAPNHKNRRDIIRSTWGGRTQYRDYNITVVFLLGHSNDSKINKGIHNESTIHHDIIQGTFRDTYLNLTYKARMGLTWVNTYCSNTRYIIKTDDDVFVNIPILIKTLVELEDKNKTENLLMCRVRHGGGVIRDKRYKNQVSEDEYDVHDPDIFPDFCPGLAFVLSKNAFIKIHGALRQYTRFLSVDDVYVTGILAKTAGLKHTDSTKLTGIVGPGGAKWEKYRDLDRTSLNQYMFILVEGKPESLGELWKKLKF
ncbi:unnamed protein product [Owenia fusiformis]|uniref:Hexosyltransferase n=1 Tax=Owenia fusiformis TaxID=6347 RepID=A0A8J1UD44_OWEFU|nr:unnamed protein product [Owenia fusiformis]